MPAGSSVPTTANVRILLLMLSSRGTRRYCATCVTACRATLLRCVTFADWGRSEMRRSTRQIDDTGVCRETWKVAFFAPFSDRLDESGQVAGLCRAGFSAGYRC